MNARQASRLAWYDIAMRGVSVTALAIFAASASAPACGNNRGAPAAASDAPRAVDAATDAAPSDVSLAVTIAGAPAAGVAVYFVEPDGTGTARTTDAAGVAFAAMSPGGSVTAITPGSDAALALDTIAAVAPGDRLHLDLAPPADAVTFTLVIPPFAGADEYDLASSCGFEVLLGGGGDSFAPAPLAPLPPVTVTLAGCGGKPVDMLVLAIDGIGDLLGQHYESDVAVAPGATVTLAGGYEPPDHIAASATDLPTNRFAFPFPELATRRGTLAGFYGSESGQAGHLAFPHVPDAMQLVSTYIDTIDGTQPSPDDQIIVDWGLVGSAFAIDVGAEQVAPAEQAPSFDVLNEAIRWTSGVGAIPDFMIVAFDATPASGAPPYHWRLVAPASEIEFVEFPPLPPAAGAFAPTPADKPTVSELDLVALPGGYDAARATALDFDLDLVATPYMQYGTTGRVVVDRTRFP